MPSDSHDRLLLAADVGGTKTLLHLRRIDTDGNKSPVAEQRYRSDAFDSLEAMVRRFLDESDAGIPQAACLAVAGPVHNQGERQSARLTNLPWELESERISGALGIQRVALLNDFQAIGYSLDELEAEDLTSLHSAAAEANGPRLVVGAGTGLGVCTLFPDNGRYISYSSEGGHIGFAPDDEQQQRLLAFMQRELERVSCERLISGNGLVNIYRFLLSEAGSEEDPLLRQEDAAAAIGEHGLAVQGSPAAEALTLFSRLYGAFAGDMALATLPTGGVYIAGGIAPKLLPSLQDGSFMDAFLAKGRMRQLLERIPVQIITNPRCGLLGAAHYAARL